WGKRGSALYKLKKYEESLFSYDKALHYKPDYALGWYNKACIYGLQGNLSLAGKNLKQAIQLKPKYKEDAKTDKDFDLIREQPEFQNLLQS
ncbi:MAG TPA: tetratricopeptide repeat protein, partial [Phormidium sp.]